MTIQWCGGDNTIVATEIQISPTVPVFTFSHYNVRLLVNGHGLCTLKELIVDRVYSEGKL